MKEKAIKHRCMDCFFKNSTGECWFSDSEDQLACEHWEPNANKEQQEIMLKEYPQHRKKLKAYFKYMN